MYIGFRAYGFVYSLYSVSLESLGGVRAGIKECIQGVVQRASVSLKGALLRLSLIRIYHVNTDMNIGFQGVATAKLAVPILLDKGHNDRTLQ